MTEKTQGKELEAYFKKSTTQLQDIRKELQFNGKLRQTSDLSLKLVEDFTDVLGQITVFGKDYLRELEFPDKDEVAQSPGPGHLRTQNDLLDEVARLLKKGLNFSQIEKHLKKKPGELRQSYGNAIAKGHKPSSVYEPSILKSGYYPAIDTIKHEDYIEFKDFNAAIRGEDVTPQKKRILVPELRQVATWEKAGLSVEEIAEKLDCPVKPYLKWRSLNEPYLALMGV